MKHLTIPRIPLCFFLVGLTLLLVHQYTVDVISKHVPESTDSFIRYNIMEDLFNLLIISAVFIGGGIISSLTTLITRLQNKKHPD